MSTSYTMENPEDKVIMLVCYFCDKPILLDCPSKGHEKCIDFYDGRLKFDINWEVKVSRIKK